ncbi:MAG TPA: CsgG/HfaB family protein [Gemmatimonadales bacterium]
MRTSIRSLVAALSLAALPASAIVTIPSVARAQDEVSETAEPRRPSIPRSQRPSVMVMGFEFNATLSEDDREELNSLAALATAMRGGDPAERQMQSAANLGRAIADLMVEQLLETSQFRVMERKALDAIMAEQSLANSGAADTSARSVAQQARLLGAKYLITGSITKFGQEKRSVGGGFGKLTKAVGGVGLSSNSYTVGLTARIVDASTGEVVASVTSDGQVKGGRKVALGGFGGGAGGLFGASSSGEKEKKIGEAVALAVHNLVGEIIEKREAGDIEP